MDNKKEPVEAHNSPDADAMMNRLNDLAARLMQFGPADTAELEEVREELLETARDTDIEEEIRNLAAEAMFKLDELLYGKADDGPAIVQAVGSLVGKAIEIRMGSIAGTGVPEQPAEQAPPEKPADQKAVAKASEKSQFPAELPADADFDLLKDFVTESVELIEAAEASLLALEVDPDDAESVNTVFRAFHTIKGTSGFLGLGPIKELAHRAESLLSRIRDGEIRYSGGYADLSLRSVDTIKELITLVDAALSGEPMTKPAGYDELCEVLKDPQAAGISEDSDPVDVSPRLGDLLVSQGRVKREDVEEIAASGSGTPLGASLVKAGKAKTSDVAQGLRAQKRITTPAETVADSSVRVRTDRLDRLIDMVGELVISHSMVAQDGTVQDGRHQDLARKTSQVGKIVRELQDLSMSLRMVPLKPAFQKITRLVRDLASKGGKKIVLVTHGEDTEIDRNMVDVIRDPLVHMVRNAVDHGIEPPSERLACGKLEEGTITLSAHHSGGSVVVEMRDDGRGLNKQRIIDKAVRSGLIESASGMSDSEIYNLIFRPGFSTAEQITEISGRGVGMDVVRRNIEMLRGRVDISSEPGKGACFKMVLPLTMAITDGMLVQVGEERYIIPTVNIVKTFQPQRDQLSTVASKGEMVMMRGELLPLYRLHRLLSIDKAKTDPTEGLLVIVAVGDAKYGLLVDELLGQQQVVAKSLGEGIGKVLGISGAAILGDGRVGLILDGSETASLARQELGGAEFVPETVAGAVA